MAVNLLTSTLAAIRQARDHLTDCEPASLAGCRENLEIAINSLGAWVKVQQDPGVADGESIEAVGCIRRELAQVGVLLTSASRFYAGWQLLARTMAGGYGADGSPAAAWRLSHTAAEG